MQQPDREEVLPFNQPDFPGNEPRDPKGKRSRDESRDGSKSRQGSKMMRGM